MRKGIIRNRILVTLILFLVAITAYPQESQNYDALVAALRFAAAEKDSTVRLALYDALVKKFGIAPVSGSSAPVTWQDSSKWSVKKETDPLSDNLKYYFLLEADSGTNEYGDHPTLIIRSDGDVLELYITWDTYLGNDTDDFKFKAKYITTRIDADEPTTELWSNSTTDKASFCPDDEVLDLVRRLGESTKFVVRCTPYGANPITAIFDVRGLKAVSMPYNDALEWWK